MFVELIIVAVCVYGIIYVYNLLSKTSGSEFTDNSIDAFIVAGGSSLKADVGQKRRDKYKRDYSDEGRQVLVLYGTEYGCSEEVARLLYDRIEGLNSSQFQPHLQPRLINARDYQVVDFAREQICLLVISTSGDGVPPTDARQFYQHLHETSPDLGHLRFSVLALGDSNYPQYCKTGKLLHDRFLALGGQCVVDRHDVDMEDWSVIHAWLDAVCRYLSQAQIDIRQDYILHGDITEDLYSRHKPYMATLKVKHQLTVAENIEDKETIHCDLDISGSGLTWTSGDALGIYPENCPAEVECLLQALHCTGDEALAKPTWAYQQENTSQDSTPWNLRRVLQKYYDLKSVKVELLQQLQENMSNPIEKQKLNLLLQDGVSKSNCRLHDYLSAREVTDVLQDFPSSQLPWQHVVMHMKSLQPRYYSIASSPLKDLSTVSVVAAVLRYTTLGKSRTGVTTTYLQDRLQAGNQCPVFMSRNPDFRLPSNPQVPVILIGPGTGIAPFMAFIQERAMQASPGRTLLYFGCRHKDKDYLYREQLESWEKEGVIQLSVAFSRDQKSKVYVQHLLLHNQQLVWKLLHQENASLYVCGDAKHMARDVHSTLIDIVKGQGHIDENEAVEYLSDLEDHGRYQKDVWVV